MSSPAKPEQVVERVLRRAEVSKIARTLQNRLALAQFKTKHGWEDLAFESIAPKFEEEMLRAHSSDRNADSVSDSSSSAASEHAPSYHALGSTAQSLVSSPLKDPLFSDAVVSSNGGAGRRKRPYDDSFKDSSPTKYYRSSPVPAKFPAGKPSRRAAASAAAAAGHLLTQSSPVKSRRLGRRFPSTTSDPDVPLFRQPARGLSDDDNDENNDDDNDDLLPSHEFAVSADVRSSPPRTPPLRSQALAPGRDGLVGRPAESGEEGAGLLLYLAQSPSPAVRASKSTAMEPPATPPQKSLALPSSMMFTPGGGNLFATPGQFDINDYIKFTPSPARGAFRPPGGAAASSTGRTPFSAASARRRLTFDEPLS